jgi:hypothetical protein
MLMYKLDSFEDFEAIKPKLLKLNNMSEEQIFNLYKSKGDEQVEFKEAIAVNLVYDQTIGLGSNMLWRFTSMPDVIYFGMLSTPTIAKSY